METKYTVATAMKEIIEIFEGFERESQMRRRIADES